MYNTKITYLLVTKVPISGHIKATHIAKLFFAMSEITLPLGRKFLVAWDPEKDLQSPQRGGIIQVGAGQVRPPQN